MDKGGPAFPLAYEIDFGPDGKVRHADSGMTLRDYFAAKAMQALLPTIRNMKDRENLVKASFAVADEMIKERNADA